MPWCPKCKEEYREGITHCADCNVELVESLEEAKQEEERENLEETGEAAEETLFAEEGETPVKDQETSEESEEYDWDAEMSAQDKKEAEFQEEEEAEERILSGSEHAYVKKADAYSDLISTGYTFILLSVLGLVYLLLCQLDVIPIHYNVLALIVLIGMFVLFIFIGISAFVKAKSIKGLIGSEEEESEKIRTWLQEVVTAEKVREKNQEAESEEEFYLMLTEEVLKRAKEAYPEAEEAYLEMLIEEYFTQVLEEEVTEETKEEEEV